MEKNLTEIFTDIADAIRMRFDIDDKIKPVDMADVIRGVPEGYTVLNYIESTGTQYINSEYYTNNNTRIVTDIMPINPSTTKNAWAFGGGTSASTIMMGVFIFASNNDLWTSDYNGSSGRNSYTGVPISQRVHIDFNKNVCSINGVETTATAATFQNTIPLILLACQYNTSISEMISARLYYCKIYDDDVLVRDYVPVINPEGVYGLWDRVNSQFYGSASDTEFTGG